MAGPSLARIGHQGGINLTLAYFKNGKLTSYRLRCSAISHGFTMIAEESQARLHRAYYPHKPTPARFALTVDLLGRKRTIGNSFNQRGQVEALGGEHTEYERFNVWMTNYMHYMLSEDEFGPTASFPQMAVSCPVRNFYRYGIPLGPLSYGEHVGSMLWRQTITFETTQEPKEYKSNIKKEAPVRGSRFDANGTQNDHNARHFYPSSEQLAGQQLPDFYDPVFTTRTGPPETGDVQDAVTGPISADAAERRGVPARQDFYTLPNGKRVPV